MAHQLWISRQSYRTLVNPGSAVIVTSDNGHEYTLTAEDVVNLVILTNERNEHDTDS